MSVNEVDALHKRTPLPGKNLQNLTAFPRIDTADDFNQVVLANV
jgi:hypothetical protein